MSPVVGDGAEFQTYMAEFVKANPGPWFQCPSCLNWRWTTDPKGRCPFCPAGTREQEQAR